MSKLPEHLHWRKRDENWNVKLDITDGTRFGFHEVCLFDDLLKNVEEFSLKKCVTMAGEYVSAVDPNEKCIEIEILYYSKEEKTESEDGLFVMPPKKHTVQYHFRNGTFSIDNILQDYPPKGKQYEYLPLAIPKGHLQTIQIAADQKGETLDDYIGKAILDRMGIKEWPEIDS